LGLFLHHLRTFCDGWSHDRRDYPTQLDAAHLPKLALPVSLPTGEEAPQVASGHPLTRATSPWPAFLARSIVSLCRGDRIAGAGFRRKTFHLALRPNPASEAHGRRVSHWRSNSWPGSTMAMRRDAR
jgi:hypothetical protein